MENESTSAGDRKGWGLTRCQEVTWRGSTGWWEYAGLLLPWQPGKQLWNKHCCHQRSSWEPRRPMQLRTFKESWDKQNKRWSGIKDQNSKYLLRSLSPQELQLWLLLNWSFVMQASKQHFWEGQQQFWQDRNSWSLQSCYCFILRSHLATTLVHPNEQLEMI